MNGYEFLFVLTATAAFALGVSLFCLLWLVRLSKQMSKYTWYEKEVTTHYGEVVLAKVASWFYKAQKEMQTQNKKQNKVFKDEILSEFVTYLNEASDRLPELVRWNVEQVAGKEKVKDD